MNLIIHTCIRILYFRIYSWREFNIFNCFFKLYYNIYSFASSASLRRPYRGYLAGFYPYSCLQSLLFPFTPTILEIVTISQATLMSAGRRTNRTLSNRGAFRTVTEFRPYFRLLYSWVAAWLRVYGATLRSERTAGPAALDALHRIEQVRELISPAARFSLFGEEAVPSSDFTPLMIVGFLSLTGGLFA